MVLSWPWNAKRIAQFGIGLILTCTTVATLVVTWPGTSSAKLSQMHFVELAIPYAFGALIASYIAAKSVLLWHLWKKDRQKIRESAPWMIALVVLMLIVSVGAKVVSSQI